MTSTSQTNGLRGQRARRRQRRAVVAVVVLLLIAVALATSYSVMRSQTTTLNVRQNATLGVSARRAALTGLTAGLREMHSGDWGGTGTTFARDLAANERFQVQYIAGDSTLTAADPDYRDLPYRVTLSVDGTAWDPSDARRISHHSIRAVVRLVPRAMPAEPSDWPTMQRFTLYQTGDFDTTLDIPCRIEGAVRLQKKLRLGEHYPSDPDAWSYYFVHQNAMQNYGFEDARTLTGPLYLPLGSQDANVLDVVSQMSIPVTYQDRQLANIDWIKPQDLRTYRVYPGGPTYNIPLVATTLQNQKLLPSPVENPLGLFYSHTNLTIGDNVTIQGTLFCRDDITITGSGVRFESVDLPALSGSSLPVRLPAATCRDFKVESGASCLVDGLLVSFGYFEVRKALPRGQLEVGGKIIASQFGVKEDDGWQSAAWTQEYNDFMTACLTGQLQWPLFTVWMATKGYPWQATVHVTKGADVQYHWHRPGDAVFVPQPDDFSDRDATSTPGLRWELIDIAHL